MVEVGPEDRPPVAVDGDEAVDGSPEAVAVDGDDILLLAVHPAAVQCEPPGLGILAVEPEAGIHAALPSCLDDLAVGIDDIVGDDDFLPEFHRLRIGHVTVLVEREENLLLLVELHVGILHRLQRLEHEGQQESYHQHEDGGIDDCIGIAVCFHFVSPP